jgi:hypothetical protein
MGMQSHRVRIPTREVVMKQRRGAYMIVLAVLAVGLVWAGVPASTLLVGLVLLACPLMMLFMHGGAHGHEEDPTGAGKPVRVPVQHDDDIQR